MKQARRYFKWFGGLCIVVLFLVIVAIILPEKYDKASEKVIDIVCLITFITLMLSVLEYYKHLLYPEHLYIIKWSYHKCMRDVDGNKVPVKELFSGTIKTIMPYTTNKYRNLLTGDNGSLKMHEFLYKERNDLCNGVLKVDSVSYLGRVTEH